MLDADAGYVSLFPLARGGMGEVEVALRRQGSFERLYAIKRLRESFRTDRAVRDMFVAEAEVAGLIRHPNVVGVLDVGEDERGPYLVMEYVAGLSLSTLTRKLAKAGRAMPVSLALRIVADAARGLAAAHQLTRPDGTSLSIVHRDVSPQNVLLGFDGDVKITDFGVAKIIGSVAQTQSGLLKGKMGYMSPEQLRFEPLDPRSDVFALGVVLYELLAQRRLYGATKDDEAAGPRRILSEPPPDIGEERDDLPPDVVALSIEMLAKDRDARPSTMKSVADRLDACRVQLEAEQGATHIADWLAEEAAEEREAQHHAIKGAIRRYEREVESASEREPVPLPSPAPAPARVRSWAFLSAGIGALAIAALVWAVIARPDREVEPVVAPTESRRVEVAPPPLPPPAPPVEIEPVEVEAVPVDAPPAARAPVKRARARRPAPAPRRLDQPMGWGAE